MTLAGLISQNRKTFPAAETRPGSAAEAEFNPGCAFLTRWLTPRTLDGPMRLSEGGFSVDPQLSAT